MKTFIFFTSLFLIVPLASADFHVRDFMCAPLDVESLPEDQQFFLTGKLLDNSKFVMGVFIDDIFNGEKLPVKNFKNTKDSFEIESEYKTKSLKLTILEKKIDPRTHQATIRHGQVEVAAGCEVKFVISEDVKVLMDELENGSVSEKLRALEGLRDLKEKAAPATKLLIQTIRDEKTDIEVRKEAIWVIYSIGVQAQEAIIPILLVAETADFSTSTAISLSTVSLLSKKQVPAKLVDEIVDLLKHNSEKVRIVAAHAIAYIGSPAAGAVSQLILGLSSGNNSVIASHAEALGEIGKASAVAVLPLMAILKNPPHSTVYFTVSAALKNIGTARTEDLDDIMDYLKETDYGILSSTFEVLGNMGPSAKKAIPSLIEKMKTYSLVENIEKALEKIGVDQAVPYLIKLLEDPELKENAQSEVIAFVKDITPKVVGAVPALIKIANDMNAWGRRAAINALGVIGPAKSVLPTLIKSTKGSDQNIRVSAAMGIGELGASAEPALADLQRLLDDKEGSVAWYAIKALGKIGPKAEPAVIKLVEMLEDKSESNQRRQVIAHSLGLIGHGAKKAIPALEAIVNDLNETMDLRQICSWALQEIRK